ncbi:DUF4595 domain-containing protein [Lacibacter luteus]|uniref:DUF4595 domain-containing protein n=1 Tax=Lacibacter luteus TaxID=2508719 RepID=A0A4V1M786_9BACT|nr:DUF4595 domain-containing protein [Lacibacter luteus]RXK58768.1 DUF4595 domain-containing protein [Lacibacter luteus]
MKHFIILLAAVIAFASCKKDNQSNPVEKVSKQMTSFKITHSDGKARTNTYSFDDQNRIIVDAYENGKTTYSYPEKNKIIEQDYFNNAPTTSKVFELDERGLVVKGWEKNAAGTIVAELAYEYDKNNYMVKYTYSRPNYLYEAFYTIENDRLLSVKKYLNNAIDGHYAMMYDNAMPYKGDPMYWTLPHATVFGRRSAWLPSGEKGYSATNVLLYDLRYNWTFDKDGYPVQREVKDLMDPTYFFKIEYGYKQL